MSEALSPDSKTNAAEFSVSEISGALKRVVEDAFGNVRVRGEVSGYRGPHSSGHAYFSLKDERARIEAVIWKGTFSRLRFKPEEGMEVIATGRVTTYPGSSKYQIVIDTLEPAGAGALMALLEERKRKLAAEGLFAAERKRKLPFMPKVIGVVTSPTGAVIRDIVHRISDRFPLHVIVWPVRVQGETTGAEVAAALHGFNALPAGARPDVIIVARGGGSLEDLWGFNDEGVVRAVARSAIPVISAVGHETDWTLIDLVADCRAPTPTGAAEMAVPVRAELEAGLARLGARLRGAISRCTQRKRDAARACARALPSADTLLALPRRRFDEAASRLERALEVATAARRQRLGTMRLSPALLSRRIEADRLRAQRAGGRLPNCFFAFVDNRRHRLQRDAGRIGPNALLRRIEAGGERLAMQGARAERAARAILRIRRDRLAQAVRLADTLSHKAVLNRGFAIVSDPDGNLVRSASGLSAGDAVRLQFADGAADAQISGGEPPAPRPRTKARPSKPTQGSLF